MFQYIIENLFNIFRNPKKLIIFLLTLPFVILFYLLNFILIFILVFIYLFKFIYLFLKSKNSSDFKYLTYFSFNVNIENIFVNCFIKLSLNFSSKSAFIKIYNLMLLIEKKLIEKKIINKNRYIYLEKLSLINNLKTNITDELKNENKLYVLSYFFYIILYKFFLKTLTLLPFNVLYYNIKINNIIFMCLKQNFKNKIEFINLFIFNLVVKLTGNQTSFVLNKKIIIIDKIIYLNDFTKTYFNIYKSLEKKELFVKGKELIEDGSLLLKVKYGNKPAHITNRIPFLDGNLESNETKSENIFKKVNNTLLKEPLIFSRKGSINKSLNVNQFQIYISEDKFCTIENDFNSLNKILSDENLVEYHKLIFLLQFETVYNEYKEGFFSQNEKNENVYALVTKNPDKFDLNIVNGVNNLIKFESVNSNNYEFNNLSLDKKLLVYQFFQQ